MFSEEPPSGDASRLAQHENVLTTPHLGANTKEAQEQVAVEIAEAVVGALRGELSATALNAPIISPQVTTTDAPSPLMQTLFPLPLIRACFLTRLCLRWVLTLL